MKKKASTDSIDLTNLYCAQNYAPLPVVISRGKGVWVWNKEGERFLDCLASYSAVSQGHCHPRITKALIRQAKHLTLCSRAFYDDQLPLFLEKLCKLTGYEKALPMNSGAEGIETALKLARKWGYTVKGVPANKAEILVCEGNFHGRTTTIVSFSSTHQYSENFGPLTPGFRSVPFGDIEALKANITPNTVGFLIEPIQAEGGVYIPPSGYFKAAQDLCQAHKILFMVDEIQTGLGRTGKLFAYEHETKKKPDIMILGKALSGGCYPISAVLTQRDVMAVFKPGDHGSTYGGNALAAAVGIAALDVLIEERLSENAEALGKDLLIGLKSLKSSVIKEVRGRGLMIGIEIEESAGPAKKFCEKLLGHKLLTKDTHSQVMRITPPLVLKKSHVKKILKAFKAVFEHRNAE